jgi:hypothetical protein
VLHKVDVEQGSHAWHLLRHGCVTGTTLKSALGSPKVQDTLLCKLIAERMTEPHIAELNVPAVVNGKEKEPQARKAVIAKTGLQFAEVGMLRSDLFDRFAVSPDAIYEEAGAIVGGMELKCPDSKHHIEYMLGGGVPDDYRFQVLAPFLLDDCIQWWLFGSFDDRNYERPLFTCMVNRSDFPEIPAYRAKLSAFLKRVDEVHAELTF